MKISFLGLMVRFDPFFFFFFSLLCTNIQVDRQYAQPSTSFQSQQEDHNNGNPKTKGAPKIASASIPNASPYDSDSSIDPENFVSEYVELQTKLYSLKSDLFNRPKKGGKKPGHGGNQEEPLEDPQVPKIQRKISAIENDVLFDRQEAEFLWRGKLDELRKDSLLFQQLAPPEKTPPPAEETDKQGEAEVATGTDAQDQNNGLPTDVLEDENADILGNMFETETPILDAVKEAGLIDNTNSEITVRDFGKWTGLSPRRVLEEACKARYAAAHIIYAYELGSS